MRVGPTDYTIKGFNLKSCVIESSLDGDAWTECDRRTDNDDFMHGTWTTGSLAVSNSTECRFIRLTQTDRNLVGNNYLFVVGVEFFETRLE
jgi:hypothetical protein